MCTLGLTSTRVTDETLAAMGEAFTSLQGVDLSGCCSVSAAGLTRLVTARPALAVVATCFVNEADAEYDLLRALEEAAAAASERCQDYNHLALSWDSDVMEHVKLDDLRPGAQLHSFPHVTRYGGKGPAPAL